MEKMKLIVTVFFAAALCVSLQTHAGDTATNTLAGVVIEKQAFAKPFVNWNAPSHPYYVLDMNVTETYVDGTNRWQVTRVTLRPSDRVSTERLSSLRDKQVQLMGRYAKERYETMELVILAKSDGTSEYVTRPAFGYSFVVEEIISQTEMKKAPNKVPENIGTNAPNSQH